MPQTRMSRRAAYDEAATRSPSPQRKAAPSAQGQPRRAAARSPSPSGRRRARSPSPERRRPGAAGIRRAGRPMSPVRNGLPAGSERGPHTLEHFARENFSAKAPAKQRPSSSSSSSPSSQTGGAIWQHTVEPIQKPLLRHLVRNHQLSGLACASFKAIMKYMGDFPTKKANLQGTFMTDKIFQDALRHRELQDEIYCQLIKQLTNNRLEFSKERGWELMWLATGLFPSSSTLGPELTRFLRRAGHKLAEDCGRRLRASAGLAEEGRRRHPPHWVEVETIQHHYTQIFHFIFFPDDKSNASFQVTSSMTVADLCRSIAQRLGLVTSRGFGLFLILSERIIALHDANDFFFDALRRQIDWEQEGIKSAKSEESDMPVLAYQMFFLRKVWTDVVPGADPQADTIFHYHQELPKFLRGYYGCTREEAAQLAALRFRARYGNDKTELQNVDQRLSEFLPPDQVEAGSMADWKRAIVSQYNQPWMTSMTKDGAKTAFLKIMYRWPSFGSSFFEVIKVTRSDTTDKVLLAINKQGVFIIDSQTKEIGQKYPYSEIQGWAGSGQSDFFLTVGNERTGAMKLHFKTKMGYKMDDLLTSYVRYNSERSMSLRQSAKTKPEPQKSSR